jgi:hypothetical protein
MEVLSLPVFAALMTWVRPLWVVAVGTVGAAILFWIICWILEALAPRVYAIARTAAKESLSQPLAYVLIALGITAIVLFPFIPYNTFGEDIKMLKAEGLTLIKVLAVILAVWTASVSISEEVEGRTALTLLSKPISRWKLVIGKFLGVMAPVVLLFLILSPLFLASVSYKVVYDARESALPEPRSVDCLNEMLQTVPGLVLVFLEAIILASIAVAISTRLPMLPNLVICFTIYVVGHLTPLILNSAVGRFPIVGFVGNLIAAVFPVLGHLSVETAISTGRAVPPIYLATASLYTLLYCLLAMTVALLLFEDRDLA